MSDEPIDADDADARGLPAQVVSQFLENQKRELEIRAGELSLRAQADNNNFVHAGKILEAQERDRANERDHGLRAAKNRFIFTVVMVAAVLVFLGALAALDKDQLALELLRAVVYLGAGAIGGFFFGRHRRSRDDLEGPDPP